MTVRIIMDHPLHWSECHSSQNTPKELRGIGIMILNSSFIPFIMVAFVYHSQVKAFPSPKNDPDSEPSDINAIDSEETDEVN